jgi:alginate O-acetyltransferase complex protein AlgI
MSGPSFQFVGFALLVALLLATSRSPWWRQSVMLIASAVFLLTFSRDPRAFLPLAGFVVAGYVALRIVERRPERALPIAIAALLLLFVWIKKYAFVPSGVWLPLPYVTVGVSYILFRMLHLVIEAGGDRSFARMSFGAYLTYLIAFNTLVAGPIQNYDEYRQQQLAAAAGHVTLVDVGEAAERVVVGLFKTNVLAAVFAQLRDASLARLTTAPGAPADVLDGVLTFALYPLFLYCNFSGYIDIVIGLSRLFGQRLPENFDRPFSATSFIDFWNRWHITLSRWLRTYVYNPLLLGLMRRFPSRALESTWAVTAFFVTFFLIGVWHGPTAAFLFFGFLQGFGVSGNKVYQLAMTKRLGRKGYARLASQPLYVAVARGLTFTWFTFTLIWFWASWTQSVEVWRALPGGQWLLVWLAILIGSSFALWTWEVLRRRALAVHWRGVALAHSPRLRTAWSTALLVVVTVAVMLANQSAPEIVYKNF